jgi:hypothetical protein
MQAGIYAVIASLITVLGTSVYGLRLFRQGKSLERQMVNKALLAEIKRLLVVVKQHLKWLGENRNLDLPLIPFTTPIYDEHAKNIGMLDDEFVAQAASFYGYIKFLNSLQKSRSDYLALNERELFYDMYLDALNRFCKNHEKDFDVAFKLYKLK